MPQIRRLAALAVVAAAGVAHAGDAGACLEGVTLFSIDRLSNSLVTVDPADAAITVVGPITGLPGIIVDLEFIRGRLFGVVRNGARLVELDPATGAVLLNLPLTLNGVGMSNAIEGIGAQDDGTLTISYWSPNAANTSYSNTIGVVGLDGAVTQLVNFGPDADWDGLAREPGNPDVQIGIDREPGTANVRFFRLDVGTGVATLVYDIPFITVFDNVNEVTVIDGGWYGLDLNTKQLHQIRPSPSGSGFQLFSRAYDPAFRLGEIAARIPCTTADINGDSVLDFGDVAIFLDRFNSGNPCADTNRDGVIDFGDVSDFATLFGAGCP
jgi:hypothetical protein